MCAGAGEKFQWFNIKESLRYEPRFCRPSLGGGFPASLGRLITRRASRGGAG